MKQKSSFLIYHEYREPLKLLTDEQRGQLLMALIDYSESGVVPELDGISMMAFSFIQSQMDRDSKKYENRCSSNRENGKKGGRPKKENDKNTLWNFELDGYAEHYVTYVDMAMELKTKYNIDMNVEMLASNQDITFDKDRRVLPNVIRLLEHEDQHEAADVLREHLHEAVAVW